jgi:hypothetical protein
VNTNKNGNRVRSIWNECQRKEKSALPLRIYTVAETVVCPANFLFKVSPRQRGSLEYYRSCFLNVFEVNLSNTKGQTLRGTEKCGPGPLERRDLLPQLSAPLVFVLATER